MDDVRIELNKKSKEWLVSTLASVGDAIVTVDLEGAITHYNEEAERIIPELKQGHGIKFDDVIFIYAEGINEKVPLFDFEKKICLQNRGLPKNSYIKKESPVYISAKLSAIQNKFEQAEGYVMVFRDVTRLVLSEKKIEREKAHLEYMFDILPAGVVVITADLEVLKANHSFLNIFKINMSAVKGKLLGEAIGCRWCEGVGCSKSTHCSDCELRKTLLFHIDSRKIIKGRKVHLELKGDFYETEKWVNMSIMPVQESGEWIFLLTMEDMTEHTLHERALEKAHNKSLVLLDNLPIMIARFNEKQGCNFINKTMKSYLSIKKSEMEQALKEKMFKEDHNLLVENIANALKTDQSFEIEVKIKNRDDYYRTMLCMGKTYFEDDNEEKSIIVAILDVHDGRMAETLYLKSQIKYRLLFNNLESSVSYHKVKLDESQKVIDATCLEYNPSTLQLFPPKKQIHAQNMIKSSSVFPKPMSDLLKKHFQEVVDTGKNTHIRDFFFEPINKWIDISIYSPEKNFMAVLVTDIDMKKKAEIELKKAMEKSDEASRAKSDFLANMSHEIRTPLNGIVGMVDLTLMDPLSEEQKDNLTTAKNCAHTLIGIINDVLDFSKIEAGKLTVNQDVFNLHEVFNSALKAHRSNALEKNLSLNLKFLTPIHDLVASDPKRIHQILNNLLSNAIKFTEEGCIDILVSEKTHHSMNRTFLEVSVKDSGIGIAESKKDHLFRSFSQIDSSYTRKYGGTGLGLVITKQLVELMGGSITFESKENNGSTFTFCIPVGIGQVELDDKKTSKIESDFNGKKVLLVEDDRVNQIVMQKMLEKLNILVEFAENGIIAVEKFKKEVFDIVLMDIQMPVMDGIEATRLMRSYESSLDFKRKTVPIIALTAYALKGDEAIFMASGMNGYLSKPVQTSELYDKMNEVLKDSQLDAHHSKSILDQRIEAFQSQGKGIVSLDAIEEGLEKVMQLNQLVKEKNTVLLEVMAHQLKVFFEKLSAEELKSLAFKIELESRKEKLDNVSSILNQVENILSLLKDDVNGGNDEENINR